MKTVKGYLVGVVKVCTGKWTLTISTLRPGSRREIEKVQRGRLKHLLKVTAYADTFRFVSVALGLRASQGSEWSQTQCRWEIAQDCEGDTYLLDVEPLVVYA